MRKWFQSLSKGEGLAGILAVGSVLCAVFLGLNARSTMPRVDSPSPTPSATPTQLAEAVEPPTPSPTPSGVELAVELADEERGVEARVPAFLRSGPPQSPSTAEVSARLRGDPFEPGRGPGFLPGADVRQRSDVVGPGGKLAPESEQDVAPQPRIERRGDRRAAASAEDKGTIPPPGQRTLEFPDDGSEDDPPPPGRARLRTGSIPVERQLWIDGKPVSSFQLARTDFLPGLHQIRLEGARGCVQFSFRLMADENVYLIWDFDSNGWRRAERMGASGRVTSPVPVVPCTGVTP